MADIGDFSGRIAAIEKDLRELVAAAATAGNWAVVRAASLAAECLGPAGKEAGGATRNAMPVTGLAGGTTPPIQRQPALPQRQNVSEYPRFIREGTDLVKIGWSRRDKAEYRHRADQRAIFLIADTVARLVGTSSAFSTDNLLPVIDPTDGSDVPSYQAYLVLRWFRAVGLIAQDGRSDYTVLNPQQLVGNVKAAWIGLEDKNTSGT